MSKKTNTILFIMGGTVFNILVTAVSFFVLLLLFTRFLFPHLPDDSVGWMLPVIFIAAIITSFLIYRQLFKFIMKKVDMEKYFDPIFGRRRPPSIHRDN